MVRPVGKGRKKVDFICKCSRIGANYFFEKSC